MHLVNIILDNPDLLLPVVEYLTTIDLINLSSTCKDIRSEILHGRDCNRMTSKWPILFLRPSRKESNPWRSIVQNVDIVVHPYDQLQRSNDYVACFEHMVKVTPNMKNIRLNIHTKDMRANMNRGLAVLSTAPSVKTLKFMSNLPSSCLSREEYNLAVGDKDAADLSLYDGTLTNHYGMRGLVNLWVETHNYIDIDKDMCVGKLKYIYICPGAMTNNLFAKLAQLETLTHIDLCFPNHAATTSQDMCTQMGYLATLPNLTDLGVERGYMPAILKVASMGRITTLRMRECEPANDTDVAEVISLSPNLCDITITNMSLSVSEGSVMCTALSRCSMLKSISITRMNLMHDTFCFLAASPSLQHIECHRCVFYHTKNPSECMAPFKNTKSLLHFYLFNCKAVKPPVCGKTSISQRVMDSITNPARPITMAITMVVQV